MLPETIKIGAGTRAWGDALIWGYGSGYTEEDLFQAYLRLVRDGVSFFDTSEGFAEGAAESLLGKFSRASHAPILIAAKYIPRRWHYRHADFFSALKRSLVRLDRAYCDYYLLAPPAGGMSLRMLAECASEALDSGVIRNVGLANYTREQIDEFCGVMSRFGYAPACLETEYSLLDRSIERNGVMTLCRERNITVIAQCPLAMGYLTGNYDALAPASGNRRQLMMKYVTPALDLLTRLMINIGSEHEGKSCAQVALNWLVQKGAVPIPGVKNAAQASENGMTTLWNLTPHQVDMLDACSDKMPVSDGG